MNSTALRNMISPSAVRLYTPSTGLLLLPPAPEAKNMRGPPANCVLPAKNSWPISQVAIQTSPLSERVANTVPLPASTAVFTKSDLIGAVRTST